MRPTSAHVSPEPAFGLALVVPEVTPMSAPRYVALGASLVLLGLLAGLLIAAPRVPTISAPSLGTPTAVHPQPSR